MTTYDNAPPLPDWKPDCRCGQKPCAKAPAKSVCIAELGDEDRDQS